MIRLFCKHDWWVHRVSTELYGQEWRWIKFCPKCHKCKVTLEEPSQE